MNIDTSELEQLMKKINKIKNVEAPGINQIRGKLLKVDTRKSAEIQLSLFRGICHKENFPKVLKISLIVEALE